MKKILYLFLVVWLVQSCATVPKEPHRTEMRIIPGVGTSNINGQPSWKIKAGGMIGAETKAAKFNENASVNAGIQFTFQGAAYEEEGEYYGSGKVKTSYLNIPLLFRYETNSGFYGEAGLQPGFLLTAKEKFDEGSYNYRKNFHKFELGLPIGIGYNINEDLSVGAQATFGLTNIDNSDYDVSDHNFLLTALVRYRLISIINKISGKE